MVNKGLAGKLLAHLVCCKAVLGETVIKVIQDLCYGEKKLVYE